MADQELQRHDKVITHMTRDGAMEENMRTGVSIRVSSREADMEAGTGRQTREEAFSGRFGEKGNPPPKGKKRAKRQNQKRQAPKESKEEILLESQEEQTPKKTKRQLRYERKESRYGVQAEKLEGRLQTAKENLPTKKRLVVRRRIVETPEKEGEQKEGTNEKRSSKGAWRKKQLEPLQKEVAFARVLPGTSSTAEGMPKVKYGIGFERQTLTKKQWQKRKRWQKKRHQLYASPVTRPTKAYFNKLQMESDEEYSQAMQSAKSGKRAVGQGLQKSRKTLQKRYNPYAKLSRLQKKQKRLVEKQGELQYKKLEGDQKKEFRKLQRKVRWKREQAAYQILENRGWTQIRRRHWLVRAAKAVHRFFRAVINFISILLAGSFPIILLGVLLILLILFVPSCATGAAGNMGDSYENISDCTVYMKQLEIDLQERIQKIEEEEEPGCDDYIYDLGEIGHNPVVLLSYLSVKFEDLRLSSCKAEIESLFESMYTLKIETKTEAKERAKTDTFGNPLYDANGRPIMEQYDAKVCYVTLQVIPLENLVQEKMTPVERERYKLYMDAQGGLQGLDNPLPVNWGNLISSRFGERIHPITGVRTFHNGIDIAVPEGTTLTSASTGIVITVGYQPAGAGYYIRVQDQVGYTVTYMHLSIQSVAVGDLVHRGDLLGATGNSGRSTGPHLHLEIRNSEGNPVDPTFLVNSYQKEAEHG